jgi:hypothetical protein
MFPISGSFKSDFEVILKVFYRFYIVYFTNYAFDSKLKASQDSNMALTGISERLICSYRFFWTTNISFIFFLIFFINNLKNVILFWLNIAILFLYIFVYIYLFLVSQHHLCNWKDTEKIVSSYLMLSSSLLICLYILRILNHKEL